MSLSMENIESIVMHYDDIPLHSIHGDGLFDIDPNTGQSNLETMRGMTDRVGEELIVGQPRTKSGIEENSQNYKDSTISTSYIVGLYIKSRIT